MIKCENFDTLSLNIKNYYDEDANRKPIKKCKKIKNEVKEIKLENCNNYHIKSIQSLEKITINYGRYIHLSNLPNLKELYIYVCNALYITNCPNIEIIIANGNSSDSFDLNSFKNLKKLDLYHYYVEITENLKYLKDIKLDYCRGVTIKNLKNLKRLEVYDCDYSNEISNIKTDELIVIMGEFNKIENIIVHKHVKINNHEEFY